MNEKFKKLFTSFYLNQSLTADQVDLLQSNQSNQSYQKPYRTVFASFLAIALIAGFSLYFFKQPRLSLPQKIAKEVIYNHIKNKPPEVLTTDFNLIEKALDRIPFSLKSKFIKSEQLILVGARYCSIQSEIAAQFKYRQKLSNSDVTLYQFELTEKLRELPINFNYIENKVKVHIWTEGQLGFASAENI